MTTKQYSLSGLTCAASTPISHSVKLYYWVCSLTSPFLTLSPPKYIYLQIIYFAKYILESYHILISYIFSNHILALIRTFLSWVSLGVSNIESDLVSGKLSILNLAHLIEILKGPGSKLLSWLSLNYWSDITEKVTGGMRCLTLTWFARESTSHSVGVRTIKVTAVQQCYKHQLHGAHKPNKRQVLFTELTIISNCGLSFEAVKVMVGVSWKGKAATWMFCWARSKGGRAVPV